MSNTFKEFESRHKSSEDIEKYMSFLLKKEEKHLVKNDNYNYLFKNFYLINRLLPYIEDEKTKLFFDQLYSFLKSKEKEYYKDYLVDEEFDDGSIKGKVANECSYEQIIYDILLYYNLYRIFSNRIFELNNEQINELITLYFDYVNKDDNKLYYSDYKISDVDELGSYIFDKNAKKMLEGYSKRERYELMSDISLDYFDLKKMGDVVSFPEFTCEMLIEDAKDEMVSAENEEKKRNIKSAYDVYYYFKDFIEWITAFSSFNNNGELSDEMFEYIDDLSLLENLSLTEEDANNYVSYSKEVMDNDSMPLIDKFKLIVSKAIEIKAKKK